MCEQADCHHGHQPEALELHIVDPAESMAVETKAPGRLMSFLSRHSTYFARQMEISAACACNGFCPTCVGVAAGSVLLPTVVDKFRPQGVETPVAPEQNEPLPFQSDVVN